MKLYLSADIEGTAGITLWDETEYGHPRYAYFSDQMTREVRAACEGAANAGFDDILVKDAHDSACNLQPRMLPEDVRLFRGWGSTYFGMMAGLDESFDGVFFTGYHSGAGMDANPLAHTMNRQNRYVRVNGTIAPELMINSLTAARFGVPVRLVTGDRGLCEWMHEQCPGTQTVAVSEGVGRGSISIHPDKAIRLIREAAEPEIELPWIYRWFTRCEGQIDGYDSEGYRYTQYDYTLPDIFESAEMHCIVDWRTESAVAFIGDSRAMDIIASEFPSVRWNE